MSDKGDAFVKGGCGCLLAFLILGMLAVAMGGHMRADLGGLILLFGIGGVIGLIVLAIYNKGRTDALEPPPTTPPDPGLTAPTTCVQCGAKIPGNETRCARCGWSYDVPPAEDLGAANSSSPPQAPPLT